MCEAHGPQQAEKNMTNLKCVVSSLNKEDSLSTVRGVYCVSSAALRMVFGVSMHVITMPQPLINNVHATSRYRRLFFTDSMMFMIYVFFEKETNGAINKKG